MKKESNKEQIARNMLLLMYKLRGEWMTDLTASGIQPILNYINPVVDQVRVQMGNIYEGMYNSLGGLLTTVKQSVNYYTAALISPLLDQAATTCLSLLQSSRINISVKGDQVTTHEDKIMFGKLKTLAEEVFLGTFATDPNMLKTIKNLIALGQGGMMIYKDYKGNSRCRFLDAGTYFIQEDSNTRQPIAYWRNEMYSWDSFCRTFEVDSLDKDQARIYESLLDDDCLVQHVTELVGGNKWEERAFLVYGDAQSGLKGSFPKYTPESETQTTVELSLNSFFLKFKGGVMKDSCIPHFIIHTIKADTNRKYGTSIFLSMLNNLEWLQKVLAYMNKVAQDDIVPHIAKDTKLASNITPEDQKAILEGSSTMLMTINMIDTNGKVGISPIKVTGGIEALNAWIQMHLSLFKQKLGILGQEQRPISNVNQQQMEMVSQATQNSIITEYNEIWESIGKQVFDYILVDIMKEAKRADHPLHGIYKFFVEKDDFVSLKKINYICENKQFSAYEQNKLSDIASFQQALTFVVQMQSPETVFKLDLNEMVDNIAAATNNLDLVKSNEQASADYQLHQEETAEAQQMLAEMQAQQQGGIPQEGNMQPNEQ